MARRVDLGGREHAGTKLDVHADADAFRHSVVDVLRSHGAELELRVQLSVDLDSMPVEDASKVWSEARSPYVAVARIVVPPQDAYGSARQAFVDDVMSFQPSHGLEAHRPLGSLMRAVADLPAPLRVPSRTQWPDAA